MKKTKWALGIGTLAYLGLGFKIFHNVSKPKTGTHEGTLDYEIKRGSYTEPMLKEIEKEIISISRSDKDELYGWWIPFEDSKKTIILVHGITSNIYGALKYYWLYHDMGYNVLLYDHRNHGESHGKSTTLGFHEKKDLELCVSWVKDKVGTDGIIGTHGESMGGATVIQHGGTYASVDFIVSDCPFADLSREVKDVMIRDHKLPLWMGMPAASLISKLARNGWYTETSPVKVISKIEVPLLIIHGEEDTYITPDHAQDLYDAKTLGYRQIYYAKESDHAESIVKDRENYTRVVNDFLEVALKQAKSDTFKG